MLPVLNKGAVERAIRFGLAVGGDDQPAQRVRAQELLLPRPAEGLPDQRSTRFPSVQGGGVDDRVADAASDRCVLTRAHLEEDAGKIAARGFPRHDRHRSQPRRHAAARDRLASPSMRSADEAVAYAKALHALVRWIGICDGNMQEGSFRCDANVSVRRAGETKLGTRCEIKNLNSFRFMQQAIEFEVRRQIELIEDGGTVVQETRLFDPDRNETRSMRSKEDAQDYRYFPIPTCRRWRSTMRSRGSESDARASGSDAASLCRAARHSASDAALLTSTRRGRYFGNGQRW